MIPFLSFVVAILICAICKYYYIELWPETGIVLVVGFAYFLFSKIYGNSIELWLEKKYRVWRKIDHKSGISLAEWEERQRQKELDEKLTAGTYTDAEKEHLIYTAQLETEKKDELRKKHLPKSKQKPGI